MFGMIKVILDTNKPQNTDDEIEKRCEEYDDFCDKIETFIIQSVGLIPDGWTVELER